MFCFQCEQTGGGTGCTKVGVCGKKPELAHKHDELICALVGMSRAAKGKTLLRPKRCTAALSAPSGHAAHHIFPNVTRLIIIKEGQNTDQNIRRPKLFPLSLKPTNEAYMA